MKKMVDYQDLKLTNPIVTYNTDSDYFTGASLVVVFPIMNPVNIDELTEEERDEYYENFWDVMLASWFWDLEEFIIDRENAESKYLGVDKLHHMAVYSDVFTRIEYHDYNETVVMVHLEGVELPDGRFADGITFETQFVGYRADSDHAYNQTQAEHEYKHSWGFRGIK